MFHSTQRLSLTFMKKSLLLIFLMLFFGCKKQSGEQQSTSGFKAGLVFDVGGRGDKSFNDGAYRGLERAKKEIGIDFEYIEPGPGADREAALRQLANRNDISIIIGIGFIFTDDITKIAQEFPNKKFACIDYTFDTFQSSSLKSRCIGIQRRRRIFSGRRNGKLAHKNKYHRFYRRNAIAAHQEI